MEFSIGQVIQNDRNYTAAAMWCNSNNAYLVDNGDGTYTITAIPMPTLEEAKKAKVQELKTARDVQEQAGFEYMGVMFDSDSVAFQRMLGANDAALKSQMQGMPFEIYWTVQDNSSVHMTLEQTLGMVPTFAAYSSSLHDKCKVLVAQAEAATTFEAVNAIVWV